MLLMETSSSALPDIFENPSPVSNWSSNSQSSYFSNWAARRRSQATSVSSNSSTISTSALRLADIAKQHGLGIHVENWREDMLPVRQYLPMQHIIGSLKRDRDEKVTYRLEGPSAKTLSGGKRKRAKELTAVSPASDDSFLEMLNTPKRRRSSQYSYSDSTSPVDSDPDRRFSYQATEHVAKDISQAALPGLNHILNLSTITADERDIFTGYAPKHLDDPHILMDEVLQLREKMMDEDWDEQINEQSTIAEEEQHDAIFRAYMSPVIPPEREEEVTKAFEDFVDLNGSNKFIAKI